MYESGSNVPDMDTLQMIAEHYNITVEGLISSDFSEMNLKDLTLTWNEVVKMLLVMYPIIYTDKAMEDEHFSKAYKETLNILRRINKKDETISNRSITRILKEFLLSYERTHSLEAVANIISLMIAQYVGDSDKYAEKMTEALFYGLGDKKGFAKKYLLKDRDAIGIEDNELEKQRKKKHYDKVIKWIKILKESSMYTELVDYYMALLFIRNIVDNDNSALVNQNTGFDMPILLADLDNLYAISCLEKFIELYGWK